MSTRSTSLKVAALWLALGLPAAGLAAEASGENPKAEPPATAAAAAGKTDAQKLADDKKHAKAAAKIESRDILKRAPAAEETAVLHVLIAWKDLAPVYHYNSIDPRAKERTREEADKLVLEIQKKVKAGADFKALMKQYSEDHETAESGMTYTAGPRSALVTPFKKLSLRLNVDEVGTVETGFGWHIIKRVQ